MPIKFRCSHCRQLLGISRAKASEVVDCPTCGRSVRVPDLDGHLEPVPEPELDLQDSRLAGALDELAQIGRQPIGGGTPAPDLDRVLRTPEAIAPDPLPDPEPIEPPQMAQPTTAPAAVPPAVSAPGGALVVVGRGGVSPQSAGDAAHARHSPDDALAELARGAAARAVPERFATVSDRRRWTSLFPLPVIVALVGVACIGVAGGYLAGQHGGADSPADSTEGNGSGAADGQSANGKPASSASPAVKGRITYKDEAGNSRPDRHARVLVFPQQRQGVRKLDIDGFRSDDSPADVRSAEAAFRALGGDVAVADEDGRFEISLPSAGTYHILVLSNYQPQDANKETEAALLNLLSEYFDRPGQLLGRVAHRSEEIRYNGSEPVPWDHSF